MTDQTNPKLDFQTSNLPVATVEIDLDTIPNDFSGYTQLITLALKDFADKNTDVRASIYTYHTPSVNFLRPTNSAFFCVAGNNKPRILGLLLSMFKKHRVDVRESDYIAPSSGLITYHVEHGHVWQKVDPISWFSESYKEGVIIEVPMVLF